MRKTVLYLMLAALPLAFESCSSEDAALGDGGKTVAVTQGTVSFTNGTQMSISSSSTTMAGRAAMSARVREAYYGNETCTMEMEAMPSLPEGMVDLTNQPEGFMFWDLSVDTYVPEGKEYTLDGPNLRKDIYVQGTLNIKNYGPGADTARIIILDGGQVNFNMQTLSKLTVLCYGSGKFNVGEVFNVSGGSRLMVSGDFDAPGTMNISSCPMFVGGNFTCNTFDANGGSLIHVLGNANFVNADITNSAQMCVDGTMKSKKLNLDSRGDLCSHDCKIYTDVFTMHNESKLSAGYIKSLQSELTACTVVLRNGGLADLGDLTIGDVSDMAFFVENNSGKAMVASTDCFLQEQYSLVDVIGSNFYFNYDHFFVTNQGKEEVTCPGTTNDGFHKVEIGTELVNVAVPGAYDDNDCNPGFTPSVTPEDPDTPVTPEDPDTPVTPEDPDTPVTPEDPDTPVTPEDPDTPETPDDKPVIIEGSDIVLDIPTDIQDEWFLAADDFAIRVNGVYQPDLLVENNKAELDGLKITEENLRVTVSGTENFEAGNEYTYEVWLWVKKESWDAFTEEQKALWLEGDGNGTDISGKCVIAVPEGYKVRKNVYTGIGGHADTPYIKVSLHIEKDSE